MEKLDKAIEQVENVLGCLKALRRIYEVGRDCNGCKVKDCKYRPDWGDLIRFNCPFYRGGLVPCSHCVYGCEDERETCGNSKSPNYLARIYDGMGCQRGAFKSSE